MKYPEYMLYLDLAELDGTIYKALLKDGISADQSRLKAILDVFLSLNVPENYDGDVDEIYNEGLIEIKNDHAQNLMRYAPLIWAMPESLSDAVFHVLEQFVETNPPSLMPRRL